MPKKLPGVPLSYTHVAVEDDEGGASTQMHTWLIDSPKAVPRFLPTALAASGGFGQGKASEEDEEDGAEPEPEPESHEEGDGADAAIAALENPEKLAPILERSVAVICLDMAQPWRMAESLETWVKAVSDETEAVIKRIEVVDPDAAKRVRETLRERVRQAAYSEPKADDAGKPDGAAAITRVAGDSMEELKSSYAGPPLIVVPCKSDEIHNWLAKKASFADAHFDYIKAALRKACLGCGAGLVYTSAKNSLNIDVLRSYVLHRMVPAKPPPALTEEHQLDQTLTFVPAGWDTLKKHESLLEALFTSANESVLTANNTMFAKIEQAISKESKRWARWGEARTAVTFQRAKSAVTFWYLQEIDAGAAKESFATGTKGTFYDTEAQEVTRVLALGLGMTAEEVAEADGEDEAAVGSDFEAFNEKLRAAAPNEFAWVIMDPSRENTQNQSQKTCKLCKCANVEPERVCLDRQGQAGGGVAGHHGRPGLPGAGLAGEAREGEGVHAQPHRWRRTHGQPRLPRQEHRRGRGQPFDQRRGFLRLLAEERQGAKPLVHPPAARHVRHVAKPDPNRCWPRSVRPFPCMPLPLSGAETRHTTRNDRGGKDTLATRPCLPACLPVPGQPCPKLSDTRWVAQKPAAARAAGGGKAAKAAGKPAKTSSADAKDLFAAMQAKKKKAK